MEICDSEDLVPGIRAGEETRLDRRAKVELFEQIRREYDHGVGTITGVSWSLGFSLIARGFVFVRRFFACVLG